MMKALRILPVLLILVLCAGLARAGDQEDYSVAVTVKNTTNQPVQMAFVWENVNDSTKKGWYIVKSGETATFVLPAVPMLTMRSTGYYAESAPGPGQKRMVWNGEFRKDSYPADWKIAVGSKKFETEADDDDLPNARKVGFRPLKLQWKEGQHQAKASITLTGPKK